MNDGRKQTLILLSAAMIIIGTMFLVSFFAAPRYNSIPTYEITEMPSATKANETTTTKQEASFPSDFLSETVSQDPLRININTATKEELMLLKSIGEVKALAIIEYREVNGGFRYITELSKVEGITDKIVAENLGRITV